MKKNVKEYDGFFSNVSGAWKQLTRLAGRHAWVTLLQALLFSLLSCYSAFFQPYVLTRLYSALEIGELRSLYTVCAVGSGIILLFFLLCYLNNVYLDMYSFKIKLLCNQNACKSLYTVPLDKLNDQFKEDEILNRIDSNTFKSIFIIVQLGMILSNSISILLLFGLFAQFSFILAGIALVLICWNATVKRLQAKYLRKYEEEEQTLEDTAGSCLYESVHEIAFVSVFGCVGRMYGQYQEKRDSIWKTKWKKERTSLLVSSLTNFFSSSLKGLLGGILFPFYRNGQMASNQVASSFSIYDQLSSTVNAFPNTFVNISQSSVGVHRLQELLELKGHSPNSENLVTNKAYEKGASDILLRGESIEYHFQERSILKDLSFEIRLGEKIALIGCNGCGKSTLLRVIAGLYQVDSGNLIKNDAYIHTNRDITYIPATSQLYDCTVKSNIQMNGDGDLERSVSAAELEFDEKQMGETMSTTLSGGQIQRVNIARGLINKASLLLADEPTASLSIAQGEKVIQNILQETQTAVVVTHHASQLRYFSKIMLLDEGRIVAFGSLKQVSQHPAFTKWSGDANL